MKYSPPNEAVQQVERFLESLSLDTPDLSTIGPRLVRLAHALDHLTQLHDDVTRIPPVADDWRALPEFEAGARAIAPWLEAVKHPETAPDPAILAGVESAARQLSAACKTARANVLEDLAMQRMPAATARAALDTIAWADSALHHTWRLAESLRIASGHGAASADRAGPG